MRSDRYLAWVHGGGVQGVYSAIVLALFAAVAAVSGLFGGGHVLLVVFVAAGAGYWFGKFVGLTLMGTSGRAAQSVYMPKAAGTYAKTHSHIDAMEARGDFGAAVSAWEALAVSQPDDPWPLIRAGELYLREMRQPERALDSFRRARDLPGITPERHRYASQKVIDLYLDVLKDEGRALVELRRLVDQHPGTREADGARLAIARVKEALRREP